MSVLFVSATSYRAVGLHRCAREETTNNGWQRACVAVAGDEGGAGGAWQSHHVTGDGDTVGFISLSITYLWFIRERVQATRQSDSAAPGFLRQARRGDRVIGERERRTDDER